MKRDYRFLYKLTRDSPKKLLTSTYTVDDENEMSFLMSELRTYGNLTHQVWVIRDDGLVMASYLSHSPATDHREQ